MNGCEDSILQGIEVYHMGLRDENSRTARLTDRRGFGDTLIHFDMEDNLYLLREGILIILLNYSEI